MLHIAILKVDPKIAVIIVAFLLLKPMVTHFVVSVMDIFLLKPKYLPEKVFFHSQFIFKSIISNIFTVYRSLQYLPGSTIEINDKVAIFWEFLLVKYFIQNVEHPLSGPVVQSQPFQWFVALQVTNCFLKFFYIH